MPNEDLVYILFVQESRWREIAEKYRADIESGRLGPGDRLPSDAALAELNGISRVTAHKALAELQRWGLVTREGRRGTLVAQKENQTTGRIALILDQVAHHRDFPRADLIGGIHAGLGEDHSLLWCDSRLSVDREIEFLKRMPRETDGIICWPTGDKRSTLVLRELVAHNVPIVLLDRVPENLSINAVTSDSVGATRHGLEFLIGRGHKRIALLSFDKPHVSTVVERHQTFEQVFAEHDLPTSGLTRYFSADLEFSDANRFLQAVHDSLFTLLHGPNPITAVFCVQDMFAAAALDCADQMGVNIPTDLEIATFNDWPTMMLRRPWQAHRIVTQAHEIGLAAAQRLCALMDGATTEPPQVLRIPAEFIVADAGLLPASQSSLRP